jgi:hypothetical protein
MAKTDKARSIEAGLRKAPDAVLPFPASNLYTWAAPFCKYEYSEQKQTILQ